MYYFMNIYKALALILMLIPISSMGSEKQANTTDEQQDKYLEHRAAWEKMLKERYDKELKHNPPIPPWIKFPDYHPSEIFWRMGEGESYISDYVFTYFKYASKAEINAYKIKYPAPADWGGIYKRFEH
mgnify:FL=1|jgi:ribosomal protein L39E